LRRPRVGGSGYVGTSDNRDSGRAGRLDRIVARHRGEDPDHDREKAGGPSTQLHDIAQIRKVVLML